MNSRFDIVIAGAGPAGLSLAAALASRALSVALIDPQPRTDLAAPAFDGREIALTQTSVSTLRQLGLWQRIAPEVISVIRDVRVFNGPSERPMHIDHADGGAGELGHLVSNHMIRRAAYEAAAAQERVEILTEAAVCDVHRETGAIQVVLSNQRVLQASLLVAADSRFSEVRRRAGIPARSRDFGKTMLVCRMEHERSHDQIASEWFDYGQTLALLPLKGNRSSAVITVADSEARGLQQLDTADFEFEVERRYRRRMGRMRRVSEVFAYPLVGVMADRFTAPRCALVGDAAVGMHPVTAHGFNLGLLGVARLAHAIGRAAANGGDVGAPGVLGSYERGHLRVALPLYLGTNALVSLYTRDSLAARAVRGALVRLGDRVRPFKRALASSLTRAPGRTPSLPGPANTPG
ncbi:MAG: 5-demethoxyubiquinol-8 5-hydroxylase UbiM [Proteobacteria bacterium]|nr:5-demethoxyubiquinol-8 5-hydroxylase UbiM [Pseudomonadota bacterium]